jgi:hypothetical protein
MDSTEMTPAKKAEIAQKLWDAMLLRYDPDRPWRALLQAPSNSKKMFGLELIRGEERLLFALPMEELLWVYLLAPDECKAFADQCDRELGSPSVAVSTADPSSDTLPLAS